MEIFSQNLALGWLVIGMLLLGLELFTGTFVVLFFACGALLTALLCSVGVVSQLPAQIVVFAISSGAGLFYFRDKLKIAYKGKDGELRGDVGNVVYVESDVAAGGQTEVQYQGARWMAVNDTGKTLLKGSPVRVGQVDGVKLILK